MKARPLRGPRRRRARPREQDIKKAFREARARAASGRQHARPGRRGEVQGGRGGLRDPLRRRAPVGLRPLRPRGARARAASTRRSRASARSRDIFDAFFGGGDPFGARARRARAPCRAATSRCRPRSACRTPRAAPTVRGRVRAGRDVRALQRQRRRARHADRHLRPLRRDAASCATVARTAFGQIVRSQVCDVCMGEGKTAADAVRGMPRPRAQGRPHAARGERPGGHRRRPAHPADRPRPRGRARRSARRPLRARARAPRTSASCARATT